MKKKTVPAILIHLDWIETIKCLSNEQIGAFIGADENFRGSLMHA